MRLSRCLTFAAALCAAAILAPSAIAAEPAGKIDLTKIEAKREVKDAILPSGARTAASPKAVASATYTDGSGRQFTIDTTVPGFDLDPAAAALNSTYHKSEISKLTVHAIPLSEMEWTCDDVQAIACYRPMANGYGELWFGTNDTDWLHSLVHEYGHHVDNQIANFSQLRAFGYGNGCTTSTDGTRDWFFTRLTAKNTTDADKFYCSGTDWEHLLPELFAEDFVVLNGITGWQLSSAKEPNADQLKAMKFDIDNKLLVSTKNFSKKIKRKKVYWKRISTSFFNLTKVTVSGARGRDFDIYIFPEKSNKVWDRSTKRGRTDSLTTFIAPGVWDIGIFAKRKTGVAKVEIKLR